MQKSLDPPELLAFITATEDGRHDEMRELAPTVDINAPSFEFHGTALGVAACNGDTDTARLLLKLGATPNTNELGVPISSAARNGHVDMIQLLLHHGAIVDMVSNSGDTALMFAAGNAHVRATELLIEAGANVNHASGFKTTPLSKAYEYEWRFKKRNPVVELLLSAGAEYGIHEHLRTVERPSA